MPGSFFAHAHAKNQNKFDLEIRQNSGECAGELNLMDLNELELGPRCATCHLALASCCITDAMSESHRRRLGGGGGLGSFS